MFIRRLTYKLAPDHDTPEGQARFQRDLRARIYPLADLIDSTHLPNEDGTWTVVAVWGSRKAADAAEDKIAAGWEEMSNRLVGDLIIETGGIGFNQPF